jgi:sugar (pentulose or hexulose) kinase
MTLDCSAVLDVGKTHVKLRVFDAAGQVVEQRDRPNQGVSSPQGYTALDTNGIEAWLWDSLASLAHRARIGRLIATTHGAASCSRAGRRRRPSRAWVGCPPRRPGG